MNTSALYLELRAATRAALHASPSPEAQAAARELSRPRPLWQRSLLYALAAVAIVAASVGLGLLASFFVSFGQSTVLDEMWWRLDHPTSLTFALAAVLTMGALLLSVAARSESFLSDFSFRRVALTPGSDRRLVYEAWRSGGCIALVYLYFTAHWLIVVGIVAGWSGWQIAAAFLLWLVDGWHMLALCVLCAACSPRWMPSWLTLLLGGLSVAMGAMAVVEIVPDTVHNPVLHASIAWAVYLLPSGWVKGAIDLGITQQDARGWWLLLPVVLTSLAVLRWHHRGIVIREFLVSPEGTYQPIFTRGFREAWPARRVPPPVALDKQLRLRKRLASGEGLVLDPAARGGIIERWLAAWLSPREQRYLALVLPRPAHFSYAWLMLVVFLLPVSAMCGLHGYVEWQAAASGVEALRLLEQPKLPSMVGLVFPLVLLVESLSLAQAARVLVHPQFPGDPSVLSRLWAKVLALRVPWWLLALAPAVWCEGKMQGDVLTAGLVISIKLFAWLWGYHRWLLYLSHCHGVAWSHDWRAKLRELAQLLFWLAAAAASVAATSLGAALLSCAVMLVWGEWLYRRWRTRQAARDYFDLQPLRRNSK